MVEDKKSFLLYNDLIYTINKMPNDKAGELFKHILSYVNGLEQETDDLIIQLTFEPIKQQLKRDFAKYEVVKTDKSNGGKLGNLKRWHKDLYDKVIKNELDINNAIEIANNRKSSHTDNMQSLPIASIAVNDNDNVNVTVNDNVINTISKEIDIYNKKSEKFNYKQAMIDYGFDKGLVNEWLLVRKTKKGVNTQTAFKNFIQQVVKSQLDINTVLEKCIEKSWCGFEAEWIKNLNSNNNGTKQQLTRTDSQNNAISKFEQRIAQEILNKQQ